VVAAGEGGAQPARDRARALPPRLVRVDRAARKHLDMRAPWPGFVTVVHVGLDRAPRASDRAWALGPACVRIPSMAHCEGEVA
jgi:hypothetical protein